jgi:Domain of unknown function (DUF4375)
MTDLIKLAQMSPGDLAEELSISIYEEPLVDLRDVLAEVPETLQTFMLVIDFDTGVMMSGMLGFLESSTGTVVPQTVDALLRIGACDTAASLEKCVAILAKHGVTPAQLSEDFDGAEEFEVTSFQELHGKELDAMAEKIEREEEWLTCDDSGPEPLRLLLLEYVKRNQTDLAAVLTGLAPSP